MDETKRKVGSVLRVTELQQAMRSTNASVVRERDPIPFLTFLSRTRALQCNNTANAALGAFLGRTQKETDLPEVPNC